MNTKPLQKVAFVAEEFSALSPAQQLLDRFLIGYPFDGEFRRSEGCQIVLTTEGKEQSAEVKARVRDFGLRVIPSPEEAVGDADAVVVAWRGSGAKANPMLLETTLRAMSRSGRCFVHGALANQFATASRLASLAATRGVILSSGTSTAVTYRLPEVDLPLGSRAREALIVVQGPSFDAELDALEGLLAVLARRRNGETGVSHVQFLQGEAVWKAATAGQWSRSLLAAAISRSNTIQGDPLKDGRTQDVVGLGLVPGRAKDPRGWLLHHRDGLKSVILVLDGVLADYNFAVSLANGDIISAQLYRPAPPMQDQFSRLTASLERFFREAVAPWPIDRSLLIASILEAFAKPEAQTGARVEISGAGR